MGFHEDQYPVAGNSNSDSTGNPYDSLGEMGAAEEATGAWIDKPMFGLTGTWKVVACVILAIIILHIILFIFVLVFSGITFVIALIAGASMDGTSSGGAKKKFLPQLFGKGSKMLPPFNLV